MPLQPDAHCGQPVEVGRLDLGAVIADVVPAQVVGDDDDDVGPCGPVGVRRNSARRPPGPLSPRRSIEFLRNHGGLSSVVANVVRGT